MEWLEGMKSAIDYMEDHLTERIDISEAAKRAFVSTFHFQRLFSMVTGVTVAEYIRRRRLTLAAQELAMTDIKVIDVALKYRYDSPESFTKAFRKAHGITPSEARRTGVQLKAYPRISFHLSLKGDQEMDYKMVEREAFTVVGKAIHVSQKDGENLRRIPQFWDECNGDGSVENLVTLSGAKNVLGVCANMDHQEEEFTYAIAVEGSTGILQSASGTVPGEFAEGSSGSAKGSSGSAEGDTPDSLAGELTTLLIPAATWAVFKSVGPMPDAIQAVWGRIFQEWFPATGYQHSGGPELEVYPAGDTAADDYVCEVWIPVVSS